MAILDSLFFGQIVMFLVSYFAPGFLKFEKNIGLPITLQATPSFEGTFTIRLNEVKVTIQLNQLVKSSEHRGHELSLRNLVIKCKNLSLEISSADAVNCIELVKLRPSDESRTQVK
ncbi:hypothetical protein ACTXT7_010941 [Hymenolepis weldensis]